MRWNRVLGSGLVANPPDDDADGTDRKPPAWESGKAMKDNPGETFRSGGIPHRPEPSQSLGLAG